MPKILGLKVIWHIDSSSARPRATGKDGGHGELLGGSCAVAGATRDTVVAALCTTHEGEASMLWGVCSYG